MEITDNREAVKLRVMKHAMAPYGEPEGVLTTRDAYPPPETFPRIRRKLLPWLREAKSAGLDDESILALVNSTLREQAEARVA